MVRGVYRIPAALSKTTAKTTFVWDEIQRTMYLRESQCEVKGMFCLHIGRRNPDS